MSRRRRRTDASPDERVKPANALPRRSRHRLPATAPGAWAVPREPPRRRRKAWHAQAGWLWWWDGTRWTGHVEPAERGRNWHPDPYRAAWLRLWDGREWSARCVDADGWYWRLDGTNVADFFVNGQRRAWSTFFPAGTVVETLDWGNLGRVIGWDDDGRHVVHHHNHDTGAASNVVHAVTNLRLTRRRHWPCSCIQPGAADYPPFVR